MSVGGAPSTQITGAKDKVDAIVTAADNSVYFSSETYVHALRNAVLTRVTGVTTN